MINYSDWTFLILAGGCSRRMMQKKATLKVGNDTFQDILRKKAQIMGFGEVLISTAEDAGCGTVADKYPERGPLGGMHAGFCAANNPNVFVVAVDIPLLPICVIEDICAAHIQKKADATLLLTGVRVQPLVGAYRRSQANIIESVIRDHGVPVWRFLDKIRVETVRCTGDMELIRDCDTPKEYASMLDYLKNNHS